MRKIYTTPSVEIIKIHSENIMSASGFKTVADGGKLNFTTEGSNVIDF